MSGPPGANDIRGVDVCIDECKKWVWNIGSDNGEVDGYSCEHGPMLLFQRFFKERSPRKFWACAACRSRKVIRWFFLKVALNQYSL
eukprot:m.275949 g.275949  ORF g.275949 m.275949 type:complete len:86 (-) comp16297_c2_seq8:1354-1611(-)